MPLATPATPFTPDNLILEGFEADYALGWSASGSGVAISATGGRTGNCFRLQANAFSPAHLARTLVTDSRYIVGVLIATPSLDTTFTMAFTRSGTTQGYLSYDGSGIIHIKRGDNTTLVTSSGPAIVAGGQIYVELDYKVDASAGAVSLQVNGSSAGSFSGNTKNASDTLIDTISFDNGSPPNLTTYLDDLYLRWGSSAAFLGDISVYESSPTSDGFYTDFTPDSGSHRYSRINEAPGYDGDTSYIHDSIAGHVSTYKIPLPTMLSIVAANWMNVVRTDGIGTKKFKEFLRDQIGNDYDSSVEQALTQAYVAYRAGMVKNPATGLAWAISDFPLEIGQEIST